METGKFGKLSHNYGKSPFLVGKYTISTGPFSMSQTVNVDQAGAILPGAESSIESKRLGLLVTAGASKARCPIVGFVELHLSRQKITTQKILHLKLINQTHVELIHVHNFFGVPVPLEEQIGQSRGGPLKCEQVSLSQQRIQS